MNEERKKVRAYFYVTINEQSIDSFYVKKRELFIGSSSLDDICIKHPAILENHLRITFIPHEGLYFEEYNTRSLGILLNGNPAKRALLKEGDLISIGPVSIRLIYKPKESIIKREITNITRKIKTEIERVRRIKKSKDDIKKIFLQFMEGHYGGKIIEITKSPFIIGSSNADLTIDDRNISPKHAMIESIDGEFVQISDLYSIQGVYVNNERVSRRILHDKDSITLGLTKLCIYIHSIPKKIGNREEEIDKRVALVAIESLHDEKPTVRKTKYLHFILIGFVGLVFLLIFIIVKLSAIPNDTEEKSIVPPTEEPLEVMAIINNKEPQELKSTQSTITVTTEKLPSLRKTQEKPPNARIAEKKIMKKNDPSVEELLADFSYNLDFQETGKDIKRHEVTKKNRPKIDRANSMIDVEMTFDSTLHEKQNKQSVKTILAKKLEDVKECIYNYYSENTTKTQKIGIRFTIHPQGTISNIGFDKSQLIHKKLRTCMHTVLEKKVSRVKNVSKPIGVHYGYTITSKSKIDFTQ